jgi:hypothetical protein
MIVRTALAASVVVVCAAGCSRSDAGGQAAAQSSASATPTTSRRLSCDRITAASVCSEYTGSYLAQNEAVLTATCGKLGGTFAYAECPNSSVLGSCTLATSEVRKFFGTGGVAYDAARAKKECEGSYKGKWVPFD